MVDHKGELLIGFACPHQSLNTTISMSECYLIVRVIVCTEHQNAAFPLVESQTYCWFSMVQPQILPLLFPAKDSM